MKLLEPVSIKSLIEYLLAEGSFTALALATLISYGFWGMFRKDELLSIVATDVCLQSDAVTVRVRYSKQTPRPVVVPLFCRDDVTCPRALSVKLIQARTALGIRSRTFFVADKKGTQFSTATLQSQFKRAIQGALSVSPDLFSVHSLRRSGASALHAAGVRDSVIMHIGRWKSATSFRLYAMVAPVAVHDAYNRVSVD
jgi:hypothetical protein